MLSVQGNIVYITFLQYLNLFSKFFLFQLVLSHGLEADRHLLRCLFSHIDLSTEGTKKTNGNSKDCLQIQLLIQECANLISKPTLISHVCYAVDNPLHHQKVFFILNYL